MKNLDKNKKYQPKSKNLIKYFFYQNSKVVQTLNSAKVKNLEI